MGKGEGFSVITPGDPRRPSTVLQIFQDAAKLFWRSWKPMLSISLILLLPHALLFFGSYLVLNPLATDMFIKFFTMSTKVPGSPEYYGLLTAARKDLREFTGAEVAIMVIYFLSSSFFIMTGVHTAAMASKGEQATLKGLLSRIRRTWKGPVDTQLYVAVIYFGYTAILFLLIGAFILISNGSLAVLALGAVVAILALLLLVYLQVVWIQGLVISVVEEGCYGLAALGRASELTRGRKRLGFIVNFLLKLIAFIISVAYYFVNTHLASGQTARLVGGVVAIYLGLLMSAFELAVYVVFYCECKKSHGEELAMKEDLVYTRVPTAPIVDGALP